MEKDEKVDVIKEKERETSRDQTAFEEQNPVEEQKDVEEQTASYDKIVSQSSPRPLNDFA